MEQLRKTAELGHYLRPFAKMMLALAARREKQNDLAQRLLAELTAEFPESPLYAAELARVTPQMRANPPN
jgi:TolA-binding protein